MKICYHGLKNFQKGFENNSSQEPPITAVLNFSMYSLLSVYEIKKLIGELGKIGSNLNQIARYFNQGGIISSEMRKEIKKSLRDIYEMKYEVMRMADDFHGSD